MSVTVGQANNTRVWSAYRRLSGWHIVLVTISFDHLGQDQELLPQIGMPYRQSPDEATTHCHKLKTYHAIQAMTCLFESGASQPHQFPSPMHCRHNFGHYCSCPIVQAMLRDFVIILACTAYLYQSVRFIPIFAASHTFIFSCQKRPLVVPSSQLQTLYKKKDLSFPDSLRVIWRATI